MCGEVNHLLSSSAASLGLLSPGTYGRLLDENPSNEIGLAFVSQFINKTYHLGVELP